MVLLITVIVLALLFDVINGFHDAANSIATIVATRVLSPLQAVFWAAFFNFIAFLIFGLHVANTIGKGIVHPEVVTLQIVVCGLTAAIIWNLLTWRLGIPSSSSHTLIGGFVGAAVTSSGIDAIFYPELLKIIAFIFLAPILGSVMSIVLSVLLMHLCKNLPYFYVNKAFRRLQLLSAAAYSVGHGSNDAQKIMGIIFVALMASGHLTVEDTIPFWVVIACHSAMAVGTLFGGWRIVKTMGSRLTHIGSFQGFSAETAGAITLFSTSMLGIPVSTTHTIAGCIIGAGSVKRLSAVKWGLTREILIAWIVTIPFTAVISAILCLIVGFWE